jgi:hypothetical protein
MDNVNRAHYKGVQFTPVPSKGYLNLWTDPPMPCKTMNLKKKDEDIKDFLFFVEKVLCSGKVEVAEYVLQYYAHLMQKPAEKSAVVLVFHGDEGTGKGFFTARLMGEIMQHRFVNITSRDDFKKRFNEKFAMKFYVNIDESAWAGDHEFNNILKSRTGNLKFTFEKKFGSEYTIDDFSRLSITTNDLSPVILGANTRRFLIVENSEDYREHPIFNKLYAALDSGNLARKVYTYLMNLDISNFSPHKYPDHINVASDILKMTGDIYREFVYDFFFGEEEIIGDEYRAVWRKQDPRFEDCYIDCAAFYEAFRVYQNKAGKNLRIAPRKFWHFMQALLPIIKKKKGRIRLSRNKRVYGIKNITLKQLVEAFIKKYRLEKTYKDVLNPSVFTVDSEGDDD